MRRNMKRIFVAMLLMVLTASMVVPMTAKADTPYVTYTIDGYDMITQTQTAYLAHSTITKFEEESLKAPSDIKITEDGTIYIADAGNKRVVAGTLDGELLQIIGEGILVNPQGIYVTKDKHVYVADRQGGGTDKNGKEAGMIFVFDEKGNLINQYGKPESPLYGDNLQFLPIKISVNDAGIMFVICESNTNGVVEISPTDGGTFLGYFGTNYASVDLTTIIYRAILTDAQRAKMVSNLPSTPTNLGIDQKGLIYTVTRGDGNKTLKLLNIAGTNLIDVAQDTYADIPVAVVAGYHDNVYVADQQGYVYEYNNDGEMLFVFGGPDDGSQRVGLSNMVTGIAIDKSDRIYILDSDKCQIQVYEPTEFTNLLHEALYLYSKGRYTESKEPLAKLLEMNSMFDYANKAMGRAYFQEENYQMALKYSRLAKDYEGYSDAYWEIRNVWLKRNIVTVIFVLVALWLALKVVNVLDRRKGILDKPRAWWENMKQKPVLRDLCYAGYYIKNPVDGSYGISKEGKANWLTSTIVLVLFIAIYVVNRYTCGFLSKTVMEGRYEILSDIGMLLIVVVAATACTYLVCTINDGEGTVKKIYTFFCYSLMPYVILTPIAYLLSHVLTINEAFLISMITIVTYGWMVVLILVGLKEVNNFTVRETAKVLLLTVFTALILALLLFIIYVLWAQVFEFISAIFGEVVYRLGY